MWLTLIVTVFRGVDPLPLLLLARAPELFLHGEIYQLSGKVERFLVTRDFVIAGQRANGLALADRPIERFQYVLFCFLAGTAHAREKCVSVFVNCGFGKSFPILRILSSQIGSLLR